MEPDLDPVDYHLFSGRSEIPVRKLPSSCEKTATTDNALPKLCVNCNALDFTCLLNSRHGHTQDLGKFKSALIPSECPFCVFIAQEAIRELRNYRSHEGLPTLNYGIRNESTSDNLVLSLYAWSDSSRVTYDVRFSTLEPCIMGPQAATTENGGQMTRKPVPPLFCLSTAKTWLDADMARCSDLGASAPDPLAGLMQQNRFRVLDVHSQEVVTLHTSERYVALSYVWGRAMPDYLSSLGQEFASLPNSRDALKKGRSSLATRHPKLPSALADAAAAVKALGERYIWIDALCINQEDSEDKAVVIAAMGVIYENAYLTIVAADGNGADDRMSRLYSTLASETPIDVGKASLLPSTDAFEAAIEASRWCTRAWTYQERHLSQRCLIFTRHEVLYKGPNFRARESYHEPELISSTQPPEQLSWIGWGKALEEISPKQYSFENWSHESVFSYYAHLIITFTSRQLTCPGDRLDAIAGLLDGLYPLGLSLRHKSTLSGLLTGCHFLECLGWTSKGPHQRIQRDTTGTRALPSWSWTGWTGEILFWPISSSQRTMTPFVPEIIDHCNIKYVTSQEQHPACAWPFDPQPDQTSTGDRIILHLWKPLIKCSMSIKFVWREGYRCQVRWLQPNGEERDFGYGIIDASDVPNVKEDDVLNCLVLDDTGIVTIIVRELFDDSGRYFERITSVSRFFQGAAGFGHLGHERLPEPEELHPYYTYVRLA